MTSALSIDRKIRRVAIVKGAFGDAYEPAWARALRELGVDVRLIETHDLTGSRIIGRVQRRFLCGPAITRLRKVALKQVSTFQPEVTLLYQGHYFDAEAVRAFKEHSFVVGYHNDDPFGVNRGMLRYRHFRTSLPEYDGFHVYRMCNIDDIRGHGIQNVGVLMPYFLPWIDRPSRNPVAEPYSDVVYVGHVEADARTACLSAAATKGLKVTVHGESRFWRRHLRGSKVELRPPVFGVQYRTALSNSRIAACFFSKWNRDTYTRRSFEIPACGGFMLSERTADMRDLFREGVDAEYFSSVDEFVDKARYYVTHESQRARIAQSGFLRVTSMGHDVYSRMRQWMNDVVAWREARNG